jgi:DNA-binding transcriptional regulator GbsR (MarR family)
MTAVRQLSDAEVVERQWRADQRKAYLLIQQQILDTAQRVAALESAVETKENT